MIISQFPSGSGSGGTMPQINYSGQYELALDSGGWHIKFLSSGTLQVLSAIGVDIFLVGGGGAGSDERWNVYDSSGHVYNYYGGGGGGGYTETVKNKLMPGGSSYAVVVGNPGQASSITPSDATVWDGESYTANSGENGSRTAGGDGGSGGGGPAYYAWYSDNHGYYRGWQETEGGADGNDGQTRHAQTGSGGEGQGTTTREFGNGKLYAQGGNATYAREYGQSYDAEPNTGNGGYGGTGGLGASGIVILRNAR